MTKYKTPLQMMLQVFRQSSRNTTHVHLDPVPAGFISLGTVSIESQMLFQASRSFSSIEGPHNESGGTQAPMMLGIGPNQKLWESIGPDAQKDTLSQSLARMFWEAAIFEIPQAADYISPLSLYEGYQVTIPRTAFLLNPISTADHYTRRFFPTVKSILMGKCLFDSAMFSVSEAPGIRVGKVTSEVTRQLIMYELQFQQKFGRDYPMQTEVELASRFANQLYMEFLRYSRLSSRIIQQLAVLQMLIQFGIAEEALDISGVSAVSSMEINNNWEIIAVPFQQA